mgnify:CR=1 FL=1
MVASDEVEVAVMLNGVKVYCKCRSETEAYDLWLKITQLMRQHGLNQEHVGDTACERASES